MQSVLFVNPLDHVAWHLMLVEGHIYVRPLTALSEAREMAIDLGPAAWRIAQQGASQGPLERCLASGEPLSARLLVEARRYPAD